MCCGSTPYTVTVAFLRLKKGCPKPGGDYYWLRGDQIYIYWVVVSNIFYFHPYLGKIPILTNIFQRGWNHQLVYIYIYIQYMYCIHISCVVDLPPYTVTVAFLRLKKGCPKPGGDYYWLRGDQIYIYWVVVSNIFYFHPYLGKIPILTNIFQRGWSHQLVYIYIYSICTVYISHVLWIYPHTP